METGTIVDVDLKRNVATLADASGRHLEFSNDQLIVGVFYELQLNQQIWFERAIEHGTPEVQARRLQVRTQGPTEAPAGKVALDEFIGQR